MAPTPAAIETLGALLPPLLGGFERIEWVQRHLHPTLAPRLADELAPRADALAGPVRALEELAWPVEMRLMRDRLVEVAHETGQLITAFVDAARESGDPIDLYRALRRFARVQEALYPLAPALEPVSRWFLEPARRGDDALIAQLHEAALHDHEVEVGVLHAQNERKSRGGFSLYVPETWDGRTAMPLIVALHGGHGHGRDFLWSWLREARTRGMLVVAATSRDRTWSLLGHDEDADGLGRMIDAVSGRYPVDRSRVLLTGMSDGGTYALLCGLRADTPFTHLAPISGVLHPMLLAEGIVARAAGRPIYLVHGALDWMFPVHTARLSRHVLLEAGARLVYRELADLSHTYPRDENARILDWFVSE